MTVENTNSTISYIGNASQVNFSYDFLVYLEDHLFVYLDNVEQTSGYTVAGIGDENGGSIAFDTPPPSGVFVTIDRTVPLTQKIEYQEYGPFPAKTNERGLDLGVMIDQQLAREYNRSQRSLHVGVNDPIPYDDLEIPLERAGKLMSYDANGKLILVDNSMINPPNTLKSYLTLQDARDDSDITYPAGVYVNENTTGNKGGATYQLTDPANATADGYVDVTHVNGGVLVNQESILLSSMAGVKSDGADYSDNFIALASKLNPARSLYVDSTSYSLSKFVLFNKGYKKVSHASGSKLIWLGAGETGSTTKAIYSVNMDANGLKTNETVIGTTTAATNFNQSTFTANTVGDLAEGDVIRVDKHVCRIESIDGLVIQTDRTLPILTQAIGSEVVRLDIPNVGSEFSGPSLLQFAPDVNTKNYGFGIIVANCFNTKVNNFFGLHNCSKVCEIFYCADSEVEDIQQYEPADVEAGLGYSLRISNGNDNIARRVISSKGRHCVDITFSHRNKVFDSKDFDGISASFLTHFNGCLYNDFIRCELYNCAFGVSISYGGDLYNRFIDGVFSESRGAYRPEFHTRYINCKFTTTIADNTKVMFVPSETTGLSYLNAENWEIDTVNSICNSDFPYTINFIDGKFKLGRQDGLFRGVDSGTPGAPSSTALVQFNFTNVNLDIPLRLGRNNINSKIKFDRCVIAYDEQPFGNDAGDQRYINSDITDRSGSQYLVTVGSGNNCELLDCRLRDVTLPFRFFTNFPATGTITFGDNTLLGTSAYNANGLGSMSWRAAGYVSMPLLRTTNGTPLDNSTVHISDDPGITRRVRTNGVWIDSGSGEIPNNQSGLAYTLQTSDQNKTVKMTNAAASAVTIEANGVSTTPVNMTTIITARGAGGATVSAVSGVTLNGVDGGSFSLNTYESAVVVQESFDVWTTTATVA